MRLKDRSAIVTGAASGIGKDIAKGWAPARDRRHVNKMESVS